MPRLVVLVKRVLPMIIPNGSHCVSYNGHGEVFRVYVEGPTAGHDKERTCIVITNMCMRPWAAGQPDT